MFQCLGEDGLRARADGVLAKEHHRGDGEFVEGCTRGNIARVEAGDAALDGQFQDRGGLLGAVRRCRGLRGGRGGGEDAVDHVDDAVGRLDVRDLDARAGSRDDARLQREGHAAIAHQRAGRSLREHLLATDRRRQHVRRQHRGERAPVLQERGERIRGHGRERLVGRRQQRPRAGVRLAELRAEPGRLDGGAQRGEPLVRGHDLLDAPEFRQHHRVDHVDHAAVERDIGGHQAGVVDGERGRVDIERLPGERLQPTSVEHRRTLQRLRHHVVLQDRLQHWLARGARQELHLLLGELGEGLVGGREDGDLGALRELEVRGLHQRKQRGQVGLPGNRRQRCPGRLLGRRSATDRADPVDLQRKFAGLLVRKGDAHRLDRCRVERRRVPHALAEAVQDALVERHLDLDPLAGLGLEEALVAARHEAHARGPDVALVGAAVALHAEEQSLLPRERALGNRGADLREAAVVLERELAREAQRAAVARSDAAGGEATHDAVEDGLPSRGAAVEFQVRIRRARCMRGACGGAGRKHGAGEEDGEAARDGWRGVLHGCGAGCSPAGAGWMPNPRPPMRPRRPCPRPTRR